MGCNTSRLDRLPAVALCRDRCKYADEALRQSYALADAHVAHMDSLRTLGPALICFFDHFEETKTVSISKSPPPPPPPPAAAPPPSPPPCSDSFPLHSESDDDHDADNEPPRYDDYLNHRILSPATPLSPPYSGGFWGSKSAPSPPPPTSSAWDLFNFFEPYQLPYGHSVGCDNDSTEEEKENGKIVTSHEMTQQQKGDGDSSEMESKIEGKVKNEAESNNGELQKNEADTDSKEKLKESEECCNQKKGFSEAVKEIQILFARASDSGNPILEMLEVGKLRYHKQRDFIPVSCKVMHVFTPCNSSLVGGRRGSCGYEGEGLSYGNLCSTLKKVCLWEKKLYHEVKAEEKLRTLHEKKCRQLRRMLKNDADAHKIDSVQAFIGVLATKMKISIQVVDKISITISKLTEEELWPQINRFIHMFLGMWKDMQECYRLAYEEIAETKTSEATSFNKKLGTAHIDAAIKLKSEVQKWNLSFSDWIHAQKSHVKALNGWLVRCLMYEPEEIPDDSPPVYVICNKWSQAVDNLSEKNVIEAITGFMFRVNELLEKHILDLQQKLTLDKELERKVKVLKRQEQKMHKLVSVAREETVHHGDVVDMISLQSGLKEIFVALDRFTATTAGVYEELCQQMKQENPVLGESSKIQ